jgi:DnaJ-class molecular chaperone
MVQQQVLAAAMRLRGAMRQHRLAASWRQCCKRCELTGSMLSYICGACDEMQWDLNPSMLQVL